MKTSFLSQKNIKKNWILIDAQNAIVGRLAVEISKILRGKNKPEYTPFLDCGDNVIVINADKVVLTGNKLDPKDGKIYYRHTGFPGGIKETTAGKILRSNHPQRVLELAVRRMISRNNLGRQQMKNLYLYSGPNHPHAAQSPKPYNFAANNKKNTKV